MVADMEEKSVNILSTTCKDFYARETIESNCRQTSPKSSEVQIAVESRNSYLTFDGTISNSILTSSLTLTVPPAIRMGTGAEVALLDRCGTAIVPPAKETTTSTG
jgi:hypothetical protein